MCANTRHCPGCSRPTAWEYTLRRSDTMLCFSARRSSEAAPVSYYTAALEEVLACRLLCYLYENSIGPEQLRDVLSDFCGRTL